MEALKQLVQNLPRAHLYHPLRGKHIHGGTNPAGNTGGGKFQEFLPGGVGSRVPVTFLLERKQRRTGLTMAVELILHSQPSCLRLLPFNLGPSTAATAARRPRRPHPVSSPCLAVSEGTLLPLPCSRFLCTRHAWSTLKQSTDFHCSQVHIGRAASVLGSGPWTAPGHRAQAPE